jgi:glycosyltransferase involved in cell wall biosynthesis
MPARYLVDATRSVQRASRSAATGIDRVERAYLDHFVGRGAALLVRIGRVQHVIPAERAGDLLAALDSPAIGPFDLRARLQLRRDRRLRAAEATVRRLSAAASPVERLAGVVQAHLGPGAVALNIGHANLTPAVAEAARGADARLVVMLHDTIPLDHPEFARAETPARFREILRGAAAAQHLLFTTRAAEGAARLRAAAEGLTLPSSVVAPLGIDPPTSAEPSGAGGFVCLGTIEGRKNHRLLLDIWQSFWETRSAEATPPLHIIGRRGWKADDVFAILDGAPMMGRTVFEHRDLDDAGVAGLMAGARALLFPSFAEGYGIPLAEALSASVPVIASDLPALREVGGAVPDWLDPRDRAGWIAAIDAYAAVPSPAREAQLTRMLGWSAPTWAAHFDVVDRLLDRLSSPGGAG